MSDENSFHMTPDEFRRHGHAVVDWIADYHSRIESFPVLSQVKPGEIRASLPASPPATGEAFDSILSDVEKLILPGVTHYNIFSSRVLASTVTPFLDSPMQGIK